MKNIYTFFATLILSLIVSGVQGDQIGQDLFNEYTQLRARVSKLHPEFEVGGLLKGKAFGDYKVLWKLATAKGEHEVIRIYRAKSHGQDFEVAYHWSHEIVPGRVVIRRFLGPGSSGWRADTVDVGSGHYLGLQGTETPYLDKRDQEIMEEWGVKL